MELNDDISHRIAPVPIMDTRRTINIQNELNYMPTFTNTNTTKNLYDKNRITKNFKYLPDFIAKDMVDNILDSRINN